MANNTEVVFENIEQRVIKEISEAHYAIFVSVAWFTNKKLFNALLEKAKSNCYVSIIIQLDEINSQCGIDYSQIQIGRSECFKISKEAELLHDKFCVIDFEKVITGSYNWTYKAAQNSENIVIVNDPTVAAQFISRFQQQKAKFQDSSIQTKSATSVSSNVVNISSPTTTTIQKNADIKETPKPRLCTHCKKELGYNDSYWQHCGTRHDGLPNKSRFTVTCKKCSRKQEDALIDAVCTKFCNFCGSDQLEWNIKKC